MNEKKHEKKYGIEWLRILSMYMVAVLHTLGQGGIIGSFKQGDLSFSIAWFLETAAFGAVDCFALISGYVGYHSHFRYKKGMRLWFQTFFYTLGITILFAIFKTTSSSKILPVILTPTGIEETLAYGIVILGKPPKLAIAIWFSSNK